MSSRRLRFWAVSWPCARFDAASSASRLCRRSLSTEDLDHKLEPCACMHSASTSAASAALCARHSASSDSRPARRLAMSPPLLLSMPPMPSNHDHAAACRLTPLARHLQPNHTGPHGARGRRPAVCKNRRVMGPRLTRCGCARATRASLMRAGAVPLCLSGVCARLGLCVGCVAPVWATCACVGGRAPVTPASPAGVAVNTNIGSTPRVFVLGFSESYRRVQAGAPRVFVQCVAVSSNAFECGACVRAHALVAVLGAAALRQTDAVPTVHSTTYMHMRAGLSTCVRQRQQPPARSGSVCQGTEATSPSLLRRPGAGQPMYVGICPERLAISRGSIMCEHLHTTQAAKARVLATGQGSAHMTTVCVCACAICCDTMPGPSMRSAITVITEELHSSCDHLSIYWSSSARPTDDDMSVGHNTITSAWKPDGSPQMRYGPNYTQ